MPNASNDTIISADQFETTTNVDNINICDCRRQLIDDQQQQLANRVLETAASAAAVCSSSLPSTLFVVGCEADDDEVVVEEEVRISKRQLDTIGLETSKLKRSKSLNDMSSSSSSIMHYKSTNAPMQLATVLENMPLVYNTATKQLQFSADSGRQQQQQQQQSSSTDITTNNINGTAGKVPFKRGHIRRSSYESAQIQLLPNTSVAPIVGRANSLNRNCVVDPTAYMMMGSMLLRDADECCASAASIETGQTMDSAVGDSVSSKRSSLDRKSQTSFVDWTSDIDSHYSSPRCDDDGFVDEDGSCEMVTNSTATSSVSSSCNANVGKRRGLPLPNISLPRGLFFRGKQTNGITSASDVGGPWRLFGDRRLFKDAGTTGLILETRPSNLPAKSEEEEAKHRQQYQEMIDAARKKEQKEAKERKRSKELQRRLEDQAAAACRQWSEHILPKWDDMRNSKRCRELWWQGIPSKVRGRVWSLVIGNELNLTEDLYGICCARAKERLASAAAAAELAKSSPAVTTNEAQCSSSPSKDIINANNHRRSISSCIEPEAVNRENTVELIHLDVSRTFPNLGIFQKGGPYYDLLLNLLGAYVCYRPDVGYVQSMSFVAAVLLLQMEPYEAFVAFANLLNRPLQLAFFRLLQPQMTEYFIAYDQYFEQELGKLHQHFDQLDVRPDLYLIEWVYTLYAKSLPLDVTCRVWDMFLRDGEEFLFKTALGILRTFERQLLDMDFEGVVQFLSHLPDTLTSAELFRNIEPFMRPYASTAESAKCKRRFLQILAEVNERINPSSVSHATATQNSISSSSTNGTGSPSHNRQLSDSESQCSQLSQFSTNMHNVKMSKSLSGFLGDLLRPPPLPPSPSMQAPPPPTRSASSSPIVINISAASSNI